MSEIINVTVSDGSGLIVQTPIKINKVEYAGFRIEGIASEQEAWFHLGRLTTCIEYGELFFRPIMHDAVSLYGSIDDDSETAIVHSLEVLNDYY